jgi:hypothetical protein
MVVAVVEEGILGNLDCVFVAKNKNQTIVEEKSNNEINVSSSILSLGLSLRCFNLPLLYITSKQPKWQIVRL